MDLIPNENIEVDNAEVVDIESSIDGTGNSSSFADSVEVNISDSYKDIDDVEQQVQSFSGDFGSEEDFSKEPITSGMEDIGNIASGEPHEEVVLHDDGSGLQSSEQVFSEEVLGFSDNDQSDQVSPYHDSGFQLSEEVAEQPQELEDESLLVNNDDEAYQEDQEYANPASEEEIVEEDSLPFEEEQHHATDDNENEELEESSVQFANDEADHESETVEDMQYGDDETDTNDLLQQGSEEVEVQDADEESYSEQVGNVEDHDDNADNSYDADNFDSSNEHLSTTEQQIENDDFPQAQYDVESSTKDEDWQEEDEKEYEEAVEIEEEKPLSEDEGHDEVADQAEEADVETEEDVYEDAVEVEEEKQSEDDADANVALHESDSDNEQEEVQEDEKLAQMDDFDVRDSDDEDDNVVEATTTRDEENRSHERIPKALDSDSDDEGEKEGDLIADIFGKSDDEDEEFTGFGEDESSASKKKPFAAIISDSDDDDAADDGIEVPKQPYQAADDSSSDEGVKDRGKSSGMVYDFDVMLQKKKDERRGRRKRDGGTFISDADDIINAMLTKMKEAAESDREANRSKKPALKKMKMLPTVVLHLRKQDLKEAFVDMGVIAAIADWLTLLPDRSLPHISIRSELLAILHDLPPIIPETLKSSGIGKAVMIMFKHPKEIRKHKELAGRLINKWSRPIFGLNDNFKSMSRGEREQRDLEQMPQSKRRRLSSGKGESETGDAGAAEPGQLRPGERGFVMRARVPKPSNKDYVIRPKWNVEMNDDDVGTSHKRGKSRKDERLEKHLKTFAERKKNSKMQRAVGISVEGNKMGLS